MTRLRSQLRSARQAYRGAHYPGDLCAELLPKPGRSSTDPRPRRWLLLTGVASTAAAAAVMLAIMMSRVSEFPHPWQSDPSQRALVDWLPIAPEKLPVPRFQPPALPDLRLQVPTGIGIERYRDLALPYPTLKPTLPNL